MVQSHCKIKGSCALPPIGGFITNIATSRKVRAYNAGLQACGRAGGLQPLLAFSFSNAANGLARSTGAGSAAGSAFHSVGISASGLRG